MDSEGSPCSRITTTATVAHDLPDYTGVKFTATNGFHHCQMFQVVMRLEKGVSSEKLDEDTPNAPNVTWEAPAEIQNNLGGTIVPCGDY